MAHINRRYIDKHWLAFVMRGLLGVVFGVLVMFGGLNNLGETIAMISVLLLMMGIVDSFGALYSSTKKHGWINAIIDAAIDVVAALVLLFFAKNDLIMSLAVIAIYTICSGAIDIFHGVLSTVDPTDRFIRFLTGVLGIIMGLVILNAGSFEIMTFIRFFGTYMMLVGITSMIYGVHNRSQMIEDKIARKESARKRVAKKSNK
ncbi:MAG: DUF308 domain-containing protein [Candidatus Saccharibacteria bacterium]|nr:DUF308 domain-containing protein [Candidatus Saccharibacteria bacterium]